MKKEFPKIITASLFTLFWIVYQTSSKFHKSVIDAIGRLFWCDEWYDIIVLLVFLVIGYLIFSLIFLIVRLIIRITERRADPLRVTTYLVAGFMSLYIINQQVIIYSIRDYTWTYGFETKSETSEKIDSLNFFKYNWEKKAYEFDSIPEIITDETIRFNKDSTFFLNGSVTVLDDWFLFRKFFNIKYEYEIKGRWIYENAMMINDRPEDYVYAVQIRNNYLYVNTFLEY